MKNIIRIFQHDLGRVRHNVIAVIVLFGVAVLPSFFGWFNVLSSWDPFGNVKNLKVAVANIDEGYTSDLFPVPINIGEQVISQLRANTDLNWVFTSQEQAIEGTKSGEYYAALVLPENFSRDMMTFLTPGAAPPQIEYYSNEKENALSPKITGEAATEVQGTINSTFTKTLNEVGLAVISSLVTDAGSPASQAAMGRLSAGTAAAAGDLEAAATNLESFSALIGASKALVSSAANLTNTSVDVLHTTEGSIADGATAAASLNNVLVTAGSSISAALRGTVDSYTALIDQVGALDTAVVNQSQTAAAALGTLRGQVDTQATEYEALRDEIQKQAGATTVPALKDALNLVASQLSGAVDRQVALRDRIDQAIASIDGTENGLGAARDEIVSLANEAKLALQGASESYDTSLKPKLDQLGASLLQINSGFADVRNDLTAAALSLSGGAGSVLDALTDVEGTTTALAADLRGASGKFTALALAMQNAADTGDFSQVEKLIGANPTILAGELTSPVGLERIAVYKVDTFGAQMAPFYTVLGLWVGALLLAVLIRTEVGPEVAPPGVQFNKTQEYFGRYGIFAVLGFLQSSLLYLGLMGFVGVQPAHPILLLLTGWVMSFVFTLLTYTLVLSFGELGKATAVFLLVVQISAGGGAYPLSVLPQWFQNISPWLPVTHATNAIRAAIAGIYEGDYWISLGQLALFLVPVLLIGLVLRLLALKLNTNLTKALESTKLM